MRSAPSSALRGHTPRAALLLLLPLALACGDSTGPGESFEQVSGGFAGEILAQSQGVQLEGVFELQLTQQGGTLSGTSAVIGTLFDGVVTLPISGTSTITGSIASGENPSMSITTRSTTCPNQVTTFNGSYNSSTRQITLTGNVGITDENCQTFLTFPGFLLVLQR
jgi:hypothetical protein